MHHTGMKKYTYTVLLFVISMFLVTPSVHASATNLYTLSSFVDVLIDKGIITSQNVIRAGEILHMLENIELATEENKHITIEVSHYIEYGTREYQMFEDIKGIVLLVKNTSEKDVYVTANRSCPVLYTIYQNEELLYAKANEEKCKNSETVTYALPAGDTRMYEVTHAQSAYQLQKGEYRFEIEYPQYGKGSTEITVE
jgi:hypothetical protein